MVHLDQDIRSILESNLDAVINDPEKAERAVTYILARQGIEANLETLLGYLTGMISGLISGIYLCKHRRNLNSEEELELTNLLKRRAWEMRQAFIGTRINKDE
jgi:hypothetical protein